MKQLLMSVLVLLSLGTLNGCAEQMYEPKARKPWCIRKRTPTSLP
ncbi:hypothetical protein JCM19237_2101 [Photobacterium aphoticum]|uniref:Lipoprotein n=1 Tax=Photobacterium aphoticum TaxID=754436 RepID=A0A090QLD6_9GAMM|nr:hypothetical protein JCM19237_2101 [Photobacterium aphoticum]